jgi:NAD(P)-dependent dehydrogenase (short-subunit alcohol dehydrogenase family)
MLLGDLPEGDRMKFDEESVPDQSGRTALITGANTGIGWEAACVLAHKGARVLLGCRSRERAADARQRILARYPHADVAAVDLDLGSLASIRKAAEQVQQESRLDLLINNAGIMGPPRRETADGFESQFGVNHLGHFALTGLLIDSLGRMPGSRVVSVSSGAHRFGKIDFDDIDATQRYSRQGRYAMSKLANLLFIYELQRRLESRGRPTMAVACHPGVSETEVSRDFSAWAQWLSALFFRPLSHSAAEGALPTLRAATDPAVAGSEYYGPKGLFEMSGPPVRVESSVASHEADAARRLWELSVDLTGVDPRL